MSIISPRFSMSFGHLSLLAPEAPKVTKGKRQTERDEKNLI